MMVVAMTVIMCVGFASCSKDDNKDNNNDAWFRSLIYGRWRCRINDYIIEFKRDETYYFENTQLGSGVGNYRVYEIQQNQKIMSGDRSFDATLLKLLASGNNNFDQIYVYAYRIEGTEHIAIEFYSNNEYLPDNKLWAYLKED